MIGTVIPVKSVSDGQDDWCNEGIYEKCYQCNSCNPARNYDPPLRLTIRTGNVRGTTIIVRDGTINR